MIGGGRAVLVVDDAVEMRLILCRMLRALGFAEIVEATNGSDALRSLGNRFFDLLLLDAMMPEMDGFETAARLRSQPGHQGAVPIIMVTGHGDRERVLAAKEIGIDGFLAKPISLEQLKKKVTAVLQNASERGARRSA